MDVIEISKREYVFGKDVELRYCNSVNERDGIIVNFASSLSKKDLEEIKSLVDTILETWGDA